MDPQDEEEMKTLEKSFNDVAAFVEADFAGNQWNAKFVNMYAIVYNTATRPKATQVHDHYKVQAELYQFCHTILSKYMHRYPIDLSQSGDRLYSEVIKRWGHYKIVMRWVERTFAYLSRYYVVHCNARPLEDVGLRIFYEKVFQDVMSRMASSVLNLLNRERQGEDVDQRDISLCTELFVKMSAATQAEQQPASSIYRDELATPVIELTADYYRKHAALWLATDSTTTYLEKAELKLHAEQRRCSKYFLKATELEILSQVEHELLGVHQEALLTKENSGFVSLIRDLRTDHLRRMYTLFDRLPKGLEPMGKLLKEQCLADSAAIAKKYSSVNEADINFQNYVGDFIALHEKYIKLLNNQLDNNPVFQKAIKDAFESGLNQGLTTADGAKVHCTELLSNYCDVVLRGSEKLTEQELENKFEAFVALFAHVTEKDMFQAHARRHLCRRLLSATAGEENERVMITKLKAKCGATFTSHFEGMLNDRNTSAEQTVQFHGWLEGMVGSLAQPFEFASLVLTSGFWPKQPIDETMLPQSVVGMMEMFEKYYHTNTKHRILQWSNVNATTTIIAKYASGPSREFQMTAFQGCVLLMYNTHDSYTATELMKETKLDRDELKKILPSFTKFKLLIRTGESQAFNDNDSFRYNPDFTNNHRKMKIPLAQPRIIATQSQAVRTVVEEDRKPAIDACLVRVMKARRQLEHTLLVSECMTQLGSKFKPDPRLIKQRIEDLINREFIERVADKQPSSYRYLA